MIEHTEAISTERALKLALEALTATMATHGFQKYIDQTKDDAITALRKTLAERCVCGEPDTPETHRTDGPCLAEQPAQQQEPAGYSRLREYGSALIHDQVSEDAKHNEGVFPLYTSPPAQQQELCLSCRNGSIYACTCTFKPAQPQQEPVEIKQIAEALRQVGLTLVRTSGSFRVMDLGRIEAQTTSPPAQPQQEPVAWIVEDQSGERLEWASDAHSCHGIPTFPLYTSPPAQGKPLTDRELRVIENKIDPTMRWRSSDEEGITLYPIEYYELVRAIEAAHGIKEKNT